MISLEIGSEICVQMRSRYKMISYQEICVQNELIII